MWCVRFWLKSTIWIYVSNVYNSVLTKTCFDTAVLPTTQCPAEYISYYYKKGSCSLNVDLKSLLEPFKHKLTVQTYFQECPLRGCQVYSSSHTHFFIALRIFIETPHCTQVLMGLGQPFPLTVIPSSSSLNAFTSVYWLRAAKERGVKWVVMIYKERYS